MQSKTEQRKVIDAKAAAGELNRFCWYVAIYQAGREETTIVLANGNLPIVPLVLWPHLGNHRDQADLSWLLANQMAVSIRRHNNVTSDLMPHIVSYDHLQKQGFGWEEWQIEEIAVDTICPHCGAVNWGPCCADNSRAKF